MTSSSSSSSLLHLPPSINDISNTIFDSSLLASQPSIPTQFIWPLCDRQLKSHKTLNAPIVDLQGFLQGDEASTNEASSLVRSACLTHGFFQVINHGVDGELVKEALDKMGDFFFLPLEMKLRAKRKKGSMWGYAGGHGDRFAEKLPWKETLSFGFKNQDHEVVDYFVKNLGQEFQYIGEVYQKYCKAMNVLSSSIMELLAISLDIERYHYRDFFADSSSIMRCNYYPPCQDPELTLGTGPHCDPTSLTILQQDDVGGLQVFAGDAWHSIEPVDGALVVNIGDTFMALSNGTYKSCLHRAVVNSERERRSLAFFVCPREDKLVRPTYHHHDHDHHRDHDDDKCSCMIRKYPDFTWAQLLHFTQSQYRADMRTLQSFAQWLQSSN